MTKRLMIAAMALSLVVAACGGGDGEGSDTEAPATDAVSAGLASEGERLFAGTCAACHGTEAQGVEGLGKPLTANAFVQERDDDAMIAFLQEGRLADHPDNTTGVAMPPRGGNPSLDDQALLDIVAFLRTLQ